MSKSPIFSTSRMRRYLVFYRMLWVIGLPIALLYLLWRSIKDKSYRTSISERFGFYNSNAKDSIWIHAVSMGEMRSAGPLVRALLDRDETIVLTHFTPAGKKEAQKLFSAEIADGRVHSVWVPVEFNWVYRKFFMAFSPRYGLVMEVEWWPVMIDAAQQNHIPLFAANAQYPGKSYKRDRDRNSIRAKLPSGFAGILAKSETQAIKFQTVGATNITVTGEIRFDQPIPPKLMIAAKQFTAFEGRPVVTISSVVSGEDGTYINAIRAIIDRSPTAPVFIYVPRAPERFYESFDLLKAAGLRVAVRSKALGPDLTPIGETPWNEIDVLLGDSMGEMYFYLALCDIAITGGGFAGKGAHNVIEPLALLKPVIVGPEIRTIEYPAVEAIQAGVLSLVKHPEDLAEEIERLINNGPDDAEMLKKISAFYAEHSGGCAKTLAAVSKMLEANSS